MTLEQANIIRTLLNKRDSLIDTVETIKSCHSISGTINRDNSGLGFRWEAGDTEINSLIYGLQCEIKDIEKHISDFQTKALAERGEGK